MSVILNGVKNLKTHIDVIRFFALLRMTLLFLANSYWAGFGFSFTSSPLSLKRTIVSAWFASTRMSL